MKLHKQQMMIVASAAMALCVAAVRAQDQKQDPRSVNPIPPISSTNSGGNNGMGGKPAPAARGVNAPYDPQLYDPSQVEPDTATLSGAEVFGVGSLQHARNVFDPFITISSLGESGTIGVVGQTGLHATNILGGGLNFTRTWDRYRLTAAYTGSETIYQGSLPNTAYHNLSVAQDFAWRRWRLYLRDDFTVSPGATFGGSGSGGPGLMGQFSSPLAGSLNSIGQNFLPSQTIETAQANRYQNTALGEVEYSFSRRSAFTLSGAYGILHFTTPGYISSNMVSTQAGYDYQLDAKNSVAVLASYARIDYTGTASPTEGYAAELAYGRKITGQLAFQVSAGPEETSASRPGTGGFRNLTLAANSALTYERRRSGLLVSYSRGLTGGSGLFIGAISNTFSGTLHHQFSRYWSGSVNGGYAFNSSLVPTGVAATTFTNWFVGANAGRRLGRHAQLAFNYGLQKQDNPAVCPVVVGCFATGFQQSFGATLNWHLRAVE
jgi:hypothetical protein